MLLERHKKKSFLHRIVTRDETWSIPTTPSAKNHVKPGQPAKSTVKPNIHGAKVMLCIWWDQKGVLYYELLKSGETINGERYRPQLIRLKRTIAEKRPEYATRYDAIIFHHDNARPHVAIPVKNYLENSGWDLKMRPCPFWLPFVPVDEELPHWTTIHIRTGYQKLAWFILGRPASAVLLEWNPQIARKVGKSHSFRWAILWKILLYMFFLNKRSNFEKKTHELSYRSNIIHLLLITIN